MRKMNFNAVDKALENLHQVDYPKVITSETAMLSAMRGAPDGFVTDVLEKILAGFGDELPVSAFTIDGTFPTGTSQYEKSGPWWDARSSRSGRTADRDRQCHPPITILTRGQSLSRRNSTGGADYYRRFSR